MSFAKDPGDSIDSHHAGHFSKTSKTMGTLRGNRQKPMAHILHNKIEYFMDVQ